MTAKEMYLKFIEDNGSGPDPDDIIDLMEMYHATRPLPQAEPAPIPLSSLAPATGRWRPTETLPEVDGMYLCYATYIDQYDGKEVKAISVGFYQNGRFSTQAGFQRAFVKETGVTHWMPLPPPPDEQPAPDIDNLKNGER